MKNKTFKANINIPCHLRFKSRYFQNFEYQENFVKSTCGMTTVLPLFHTDKDESIWNFPV